MKFLLGIIFLVVACAEERANLKGSLRNGNAIAQESTIGSGSSLDNPEASAAAPLDAPLQRSEGDAADLGPSPAADLATPPQVVNGAYLYCAEINEVGTRIEVGCRMNDADGQYVKAETLAGKILYFPIVPATEGLTLDILTLNQIDRTFDVLYFFDASQLDISRQAVSATTVKVTLENPIQENRFIASETQVKAVLPAVWFSITAFSGEKLVTDLATGISFTRLNGLFDWNNAKLNCESLNRAGSDEWVVATLPMLSSAHAHGLMVNKNAAQALDLLSVGNLTFWANDPDDDALTTAHFMLLEDPDNTKAIRIEPKSNVKSVICQL